MGLAPQLESRKAELGELPPRLVTTAAQSRPAR